MAATETSNTPRTHKTRNNTDSNAKKVSIEALNARLADGIDLALAIKQAHWNLKGPQFIGVHEMLDGTKLPAYPTGIYAIADHIAALIDSYAAYANAVRQNIEETDEAGDPDTADLFTEISRAVDKHLWFLKADVQEPTGTLRDGNK